MGVVANVVIYWKYHFMSCHTGGVRIPSGCNSFHLCGNSTLSSSLETFSKFGMEAITELRYSLIFVSWSW